MTAAELWGVARRRLIDELGREVTEPVSFVDDDRVRYEISDRILVSHADLFDLDDLERWRPY